MKFIKLTKLNIFFLIFSFSLLIYMIWPGPISITEFQSLPNSTKSTLSGDTWQIPNVSAYFSNNYRKTIVPFYKVNFQSLSHFPFPPLRLNYPPEFSWTAIKKHTDSTYLEELVYPLRDSIFVNGFEPFYEDGQPKYWGATKFVADNKISYDTKTTLRFYPSPIWAKLLTWLGITLGIAGLYTLSRNLFLNE